VGRGLASAGLALLMLVVATFAAAPSAQAQVTAQSLIGKAV
jgi:hypothetical protein